MNRRWGNTELGWGLLSALLLWVAFPPLALWPLAWLAPLGWLRLIGQSSWRSAHPYRMLYGVGLLHWLLLVQWIRLPHWSAYFGWLALAGYLAVYVPLFVGLSRVLVHGWGISSVFAAPVVWTGLELARGYLLTGFSMSLLGHTQLSWLPLVQIADLVGAYGVSFLVMLVAACLDRLAGRAPRPRLAWPLLTTLVALSACLVYGTLQLRRQPAAEAQPRRLRVALIQGAFDTQFDGNPQRANDAFFDYLRLSRQAADRYRDLDLMIWPESMFTGTEPMVTYDPPLALVPGWDGTLDQLQQRLDQIEAATRQRFVWMAQQVRTPILVGLAWDHFVEGRVERFNSAVLADRGGTIVDRYDKMHPVMFGEYVPLGTWFPWLYRLTPMDDGLTAGRAPRAFQVGPLRVAPTICFENTVPHLVRRQVRQLRQQRQSPDMLVTVTNDGWFWGSSLLDVHLACGVFRAIELRRPLLIAANTGFSAWIDPLGRIRARGPRRAEGILLADVPVEPRRSWYLEWGDWFAGLCLLITLLAPLSRVKRPKRV